MGHSWKPDGKRFKHWRCSKCGGYAISNDVPDSEQLVSFKEKGTLNTQRVSCEEKIILEVMKS